MYQNKPHMYLEDICNEYCLSYKKCVYSKLSSTKLFVYLNQFLCMRNLNNFKLCYIIYSKLNLFLSKE